jgi:hypothetical protein
LPERHHALLRFLGQPVGFGLELGDKGLH